MGDGREIIKEGMERKIKDKIKQKIEITLLKLENLMTQRS